MSHERKALHKGSWKPGRKSVALLGVLCIAAGIWMIIQRFLLWLEPVGFFAIILGIIDLLIAGVNA